MCKWTSYAIRLTVVAAAYFFTGMIGIYVSNFAKFGSLVWPPAGIAVAALLLRGRNLWPAVVIGACLTNFCAGAPLIAALGTGIGAGAEALFCATALRLLPIFNNSFNRLPQVLGLLFFAPVGSLFSATIGVGSLFLGHWLASNIMMETWRSWWLGDTLGIIIVAPFVCTWASQTLMPISKIKYIEAFALGSLIVVSTLSVFHETTALGRVDYPIAYSIFPLIIWAALRFGVKGTTLSTVVVSTLTIWGSLYGLGPFAIPGLARNLLYLHAFQGVLAATGLILAAVMSEKHQMSEELISSHLALEKKFLTRTEQLRDSEQRFRLLVSSVRDYAIFMLDPLGQIVSWNEGAKRIMGHETSEIIGKSFAKLYLHEDTENNRPSEDLDRAIDKQRFEKEGFRIRKDGTIFWASIVLSAVNDTQGRLLGFAQIIQDLTEKKIVQDTLRQAHDDLEIRVRQRTSELAQSRDQLEIIIRGINDGICVLDNEGRYQYVNDAYKLILGLDSSIELPNFDINEFLNSCDIRNEQQEPLSSIEMPWNIVLQGAPSAERQFCARIAGEVRWLSAKSKPVFDEASNTRLAVTIINDFTERKRIEDTTIYLDVINNVLASSLDYEQTFSKIAELAVPALADGCVIQILENGGQLRTLAISHVDIDQNAILEQIRREYPSEQMLWSTASQVAVSGKSLVFDQIQDSLLESVAIDSHHLDLLRSLHLKSVIVVPLRARGKILGSIALLSSVSYRRYSAHDQSLAEEVGRRGGIAIDNASLYREAQNAVKIRDDFLSVASHELKTPMTTLKLQTELRKRKLSLTNSKIDLKSLTQMIEKDEKQIDRLTRLIDDMLDISRIQGGRLTLTKERIDLRHLVDDVLERFGDQLQSAGCPVLIHGDAEVWGNWDQLRIEQIFINLLTNAMKYGSKRPIHVLVEKDGVYARLVVRDQGIGIEKSDHQRIFEQFERLTQAKHVTGLGLGLYIAKQIVEAHGGTLELHSEVNIGSTFIIEIPLITFNAEQVRA
jgi:PAS domain S-box-containing protein